MFDPTDSHCPECKDFERRPTLLFVRRDRLVKKCSNPDCGHQWAEENVNPLSALTHDRT